MIQVNNLKKIRKGHLVVNNLNFSVNDGETLGIIGLSKSGKSLTLNMLCGAIPYSKGSVEICGFDLKFNPIMAKKNIGYMSRDFPLYDFMSVESYLNFIFDLKKVDFNRSSHISDICEMLNLKGIINKNIKSLSFIEKKYVSLAQALIGNPKILILNNPTKGLLREQVLDMENAIKTVSAGKTLIISTNDLKDIRNLCERVIVMDNGKIIADDKTQELFRILSGNYQYLIEVEGDKSIIQDVLTGVSGVFSLKELESSNHGTFKCILESGYHIDIRASVVNALEKARLKIVDFHRYKLDLENVVYRLTDRNSMENFAESFFDENE